MPLLAALLGKITPYATMGKIAGLVAAGAFCWWLWGNAAEWKQTARANEKTIVALKLTIDAEQAKSQDMLQRLTRALADNEVAAKRLAEARRRQKEVLNVDPAKDGPCPAVLCDDPL